MGSSERQMCESMALLNGNQLECWLFGGWAEEVRGAKPREHKDIDLLLLSTDFAALDEFLAREQLQPSSMPAGEAKLRLQTIPDKRSPHKRAFLQNNTLVEVFLVQEDDEGFFTDFWGHTRCRWPEDSLGYVGGFPVASTAALELYKERYPDLRAASEAELV